MTRRVTSWYQLTNATDDGDDDDEVTTSVRRLIDVLVTSQDSKCRRNVDDACQYHSLLNGFSDKHGIQVGGFLFLVRRLWKCCITSLQQIQRNGSSGVAIVEGSGCLALATGDWWCVVGPKVAWGTSTPDMSLVWVAGGNRDHVE